MELHGEFDSSDEARKIPDVLTSRPSLPSSRRPPLPHPFTWWTTLVTRAIASLMESGVEFVACDQPQANKFTVPIFAALAEQERDMISERTRRALQVLKAQGKQLGTPANLTPAAQAQGLAVRQQNARTHEANRQATALILARRAQGHGYNQIAQELESLGFRTRRGCQFTHKQVQRLAQRATE
ncbi:hypothetical protein SAMN00120144_4295 [Hymenobacter roseosalivarius DSM 11622]|uniref:Uncharacterized protein n=1 Tax=Hymenobacter roseosalivarius DSM 11622 TaxID=645990 RepID=A0A1W1UK75_9BACT|nr:hypothetical protein SAMN00120144_4295 [Hymenobacter roseosalivarius DSM 11622]